MSLADIKAGDAVALRGTGYNTSIYKVIVEHATAARLTVDAVLYSRRDGQKVGSLNRFRYIEAWDETHHGALLAAETLKDLQWKLQKFNWYTLSADQCAAVLAIIEAKELE